MTTDNYPLFYQLRYAGQFPLVFKIKLISLCAVKMAHQEKVAHLSLTSVLQRVEGYCAEGIYSLTGCICTECGSSLHSSCCWW